VRSLDLGLDIEVETTQTRGSWQPK
jgi:hypothetical protein